MTVLRSRKIPFYSALVKSYRILHSVLDTVKEECVQKTARKVGGTSYVQLDRRLRGSVQRSFRR